MRRSFVAVAVTFVVACSTFGITPSTDAGTDAAIGASTDAADVPDVAALDAGSGDAGDDAGVIVGRACQLGEVQCNGSCIAAADCRGCPTAPLLCDATGTCGADCTACAGAPIECVACDSTQKNPVGTCQPASATAFCLNGSYGAGEHCDCSNGVVANCIAGSQVCLPAGMTDWCVTCGENGILTNGVTCKNGKVCNATSSPPRCQ